MPQRPLSITIIGWLFVAVGCVAMTYHLLPRHVAEVQGELLWICFVRAVALLSGLFVLFGCNWARWVLAAWMAYHVVLSFLHGPSQVAVHGVLFGVIGYFLFRREAAIYFHRRRAASVEVEPLGGAGE